MKLLHELQSEVHHFSSQNDLKCLHSQPEEFNLVVQEALVKATKPLGISVGH